MEGLDERDRLLAELTSVPEEASLIVMSRAPNAGTEEAGASTAASPAAALPRAADGRERSKAAGANVFRGRELREAATRVLFLTSGADRVVHYRNWLDEVLKAGIDVIGKDPVATFLTNVSRSPVVVRGDEPGTYRIDTAVAAETRRQLAEAEAELADIGNVIARDANPGADLREHRSRLAAAVRRLEGQVAEMDRVMAPPEGRASTQDDDGQEQVKAEGGARSA